MSRPKNVALLIHANTWATVERLSVYASEKTGKVITPEETAVTLVETGIRAMAEGLHKTCDPAKEKLARVLMGLDEQAAMANASPPSP